MAFFTSAVTTLQTLVVALGAGLGVWGVVNLLEGYGSDNPGSNAHVRYVYCKNIMGGVSNIIFAPNVELTRGMAVVILHRLEGEPEAAASGFSDVAAGSWYFDAVNWAAENSIVLGFNAEKFGPEELLTREQLAAIFYRYAQYKGYDVSGRADLSRYSDVDEVHDYALEATQWAVSSGLIGGFDDNTLNPRGGATRAQAAEIIKRFCETTQAPAGKGDKTTD